MKPHPHIFNIPAGEPFLKLLANAILHNPSLSSAIEQGSAAPENMQIFLPTRRATTSLANTLATQAKKPILLPQLNALGDMTEDEEEPLLAEETPTPNNPETTNLPPAIKPLAKRMILTRLVREAAAQKTMTMSWGTAARLAADLSRLADTLAHQDIPPERLAELPPEDMTEHWQFLLQFLEILMRALPDYLAKLRLMDPIARRNAATLLRARHLRDNPPTAPVLAAGSTGANPATAQFLKTIAAMPNGAIILPGLDTAMTDAAWNAITEAHPQYAMKKLLNHLKVSREEVRIFPDAEENAPRRARRALLSAAFHPTERRKASAARLARGEIRLIEAETPEAEARAIALILRQALETKNLRAALITRDRGLARRVRAEMRRWRVALDDSAGAPLTSAPIFVFLRLIAEAALEGLTPLSLLSLLKHPLTACGMKTSRLRQAARRLEKNFLRQGKPVSNLADLKSLLSEEGKGKRQEAANEARALAEKLEKSLQPFLALMEETKAPFHHLVRRHLEAAETLAFDGEKEGAARLWDPSRAEGRAASGFFAEILANEEKIPAIPPGDYPALLEEMAAGAVWRPPYRGAERLFLWGRLEARLQEADLVILGGLNETVWPRAVAEGPWFNRAMTKALGLPPPETFLGLAAHDFAQSAMGASRLVLTRAAQNEEGAPQSPSRFLTQLEAFREEEAGSLEKDTEIPAFARRLDEPNHDAPEEKPQPAPPLKIRPKSLSISGAETLLNDPYAFYARYILNLRPLEPLEADAPATAQGLLFHEILEEFVREHPEALPPDAEKRLMETAESRFARYGLNAPLAAFFWTPIFESAARRFINLERGDLRRSLRRAHLEVKGEIALPTETPIVIHGRADRIDMLQDGTLAIYDYKTGQAPTRKSVQQGFRPQLVLAAMIAEKGGFDGVPPMRPSRLGYIAFKRGKGSEKSLAEIPDPIPLMEALRQPLADYLTRYLLREKTVFAPKEAERRLARSDYDRLSRITSWSVIGDEGEREEEAR